MNDITRITINDSHLFQTVGQLFVLGEAFAFVSPETLARPELAWFKRISGGRRSVILSLLGSEAVDLPGMQVRSKDICRLNLSAITSDKRLYRCGEEETHLLVLRPQLRCTRQAITVQLNGKEFATRTVELGNQGEGALRLKDLPVGEFSVFFKDQADDSESACRFEVAEYRLVPLVATLVERRVKDETVLAKLQLESFGVAVDGEVRVDMLDGGRRSGYCMAKAVNGRLEAVLPIDGHGPHELSLQLVADASKTATVPLPGSRLSERSQTVFSALGTEITGSLMPSADTDAVRGIYLGEGAMRNSPVTLERVDSRSIRLRANRKIESLMVVATNSVAPTPAASAVDPTPASHPGHKDPSYVRAEQLFKQGRIRDALAMFEEGIISSAHPYYAYFAACCYAQLQEPERAIEKLELAIVQGWRDLEHMANDHDLRNIWDRPEFRDLCQGGVKSITYDNLQSGQVIELSAFSPVTVLALGAFIDGKPWEGSACILVPSQLEAPVMVPEKCTPGEELNIEISSACKNQWVAYVLVKDARLQSIDNPLTRLGGKIKNLAELVSKELPVHFPESHLSMLVNRSDYYVDRARGMTAYAAFDPLPGSSEPLTLGESIARSVSGMSRPAPGAAAPPPSAQTPRVRNRLSEKFGMAMFAQPEMDVPSHETAWGAAAPAQSSWAAVDELALRGSIGAVRLEESEQEALVAKQGGEERKATELQEPQTLFAGFVRGEEGKAILTVPLPDRFASYIVECFVISGYDWSYSEHQLLAEKDPAIDLVMPVFASVDQPVWAKLFVKSADTMCVKIYREGKEVDLFQNFQRCSGELLAGQSTLQFLVSPGSYEAVVETKGGTSRLAKHVSELGKLRYRQHALRLLLAGETISLADQPGLVSLKVLPGVDTSFDLLIDATADYAHCCCEQTAAKIISGCAMYMFAGDDGNRRKKAEAVILAGIRRENSMWVPQRGFKAYPHMNAPDSSYVGPTAAKHLWTLELMRNLEMSSDLKGAITDGLEMTKDASRAYGLQCPPRKLTNCHDAYAALRFAEDGKKDDIAVEFVRKSLAGRNAREFAKSLPRHPYTGYAVNSRCESAYAAAVLLRHGDSQDKYMAIELANEVIKDFNQEGRLYSTVDSVAAIALMSELIAAKIGIGAGSMEINGALHTAASAVSFAGEAETIKVIEGVALVEVVRSLEEDWNRFASNVQLRVSLEKNGKPHRVVSAGDALELRVTLEEGYKDGDLLWICLPDAVSRIIGGGQVKQFCLDFAGKQELAVPLAATELSRDQHGNLCSQGIFVCVRNMFEEERVGCPGIFELTVKQ